MHSAFSIFLSWEGYYYFFLNIFFLSHFPPILYKLSYTFALFIKSYYSKYCDSTNLCITETSGAWASGLLLGNVLVLSDIKVWSDPVKYLAGMWGIDLFRGSGFGKLPGTTEGRGPPVPARLKGGCYRDTLRVQGNPRGKNGALLISWSQNTIWKILSGQASSGWLTAHFALTAEVCSFILTMTIWWVDPQALLGFSEALYGQLAMPSGPPRTSLNAFLTVPYILKVKGLPWVRCPPWSNQLWQVGGIMWPIIYSSGAMGKAFCKKMKPEGANIALGS